MSGIVKPDYLLDTEIAHKHDAAYIFLSNGQSLEDVVIHDKGWFATDALLKAAYPVANSGDWAIVGSTDTVWDWDADTNNWKDGGISPLEVTKTTAALADNVLQLSDGLTRKIKDATGLTWTVGTNTLGLAAGSTISGAGALTIATTGATALDLKTNGNTRWSITSAGVLQATGAQVISTTTGKISIQNDQNITLTVSKPLEVGWDFYSFGGGTGVGRISLSSMTSNSNYALQAELNGTYLNGGTTCAIKVGGNSYIYCSAGKVCVLTETTTYDLSLRGSQSFQIGMVRNTTTATAGQNLTINAGGATSGSTDKNGGNLILQSSPFATGDGGSNIRMDTIMYNQGSATTDRTPGVSSMVVSSRCVDDAVLTNIFTINGVAAAKSGTATVTFGDGLGYAIISFTAAGVPTIITASANVATTDTNLFFCLYAGTNQVVVKNRLGSTYNATFQIIYNQ